MNIYIYTNIRQRRTLNTQINHLLLKVTTTWLRNFLMSTRNIWMLLISTKGAFILQKTQGRIIGSVAANQDTANAMIGWIEQVRRLTFSRNLSLSARKETQNHKLQSKFHMNLSKYTSNWQNRTKPEKWTTSQTLSSTMRSASM